MRDYEQMRQSGMTPDPLPEIVFDGRWEPLDLRKQPPSSNIYDEHGYPKLGYIPRLAYPVMAKVELEQEMTQLVSNHDQAMHLRDEVMQQVEEEFTNPISE